MPNKENLIKDYEWVVRVIRSCETGKQLDGAMNLYDLWLRKHSRLGDNDGLYILEYSRKIYSEIIKKFDLYEKQSV